MAEAAPEQENSVVYFAKTNFRNRERIFGIKQIDRRQHMYVIGQTGTGKSTLLKNLALQDIKSGRGVCIVDPHGEFVEEVLEKIPEERMNDVIYFNPADSEYPIGFNVLELPDPQYKHLAASSLMGIFTKIWANVWSARMEYILNNAILALLDTPGTSLLGVPRILVDKDYRTKILANVKDPVVKAFWVQEYEQYDPRFRNEAIAPIQNKVGQFLSSSVIRNIVGQSKSTINIFDLMNQEKILLVNVSKGRIGEDNSALLGAMIITKVQLAAMERIRISENERKDFYLYVDEFQNFATDSFASILSEARKYRLNLVIAHQYIGQLITDTSTKVRDAVFGNVGTMISFRVGAADAEYLEKEFTPEFTIQDLVNLPNRTIYLKLMVENTRSRPFSAATLPVLQPDVGATNVEKILESSRKSYAPRLREDVEKEVNEQWEEDKKAIASTQFVQALGGRVFTQPQEQRSERPRFPQSEPARVGGRPDYNGAPQNGYANRGPVAQQPRDRQTSIQQPYTQQRMMPRDGEFVVRKDVGRDGNRGVSLNQLRRNNEPQTQIQQKQETPKRELHNSALRSAIEMAKPSVVQRGTQAHRAAVQSKSVVLPPKLVAQPKPSLPSDIQTLIPHKLEQQNNMPQLKRGEKLEPGKSIKF